MRLCKRWVISAPPSNFYDSEGKSHRGNRTGPLSHSIGLEKLSLKKIRSVPAGRQQPEMSVHRPLSAGSTHPATALDAHLGGPESTHHCFTAL